MWTISLPHLQIPNHQPYPHRCKEGASFLGIASSNASPFLEDLKDVFYYMTMLIHLFVDFALLFTILFRGYADFYTQCFCRLYDGVCIIAFISKKSKYIKTLYQLESERAISCGTRCNKYSDDTTKRILFGKIIPVEFIV